MSFARLRLAAPRPTPGSPSLPVSRRTFRALALLAALAASASCTPAPSILTPADGSYVPSPPGGAGVPVQIQLGGGFGPGSSFRVTLLAGVDAPPASFLDLTQGFAQAGGVATGEIAAEQLREGRNTLFASIDADGNGIAENVVSASFSWEPGLAIETAHRCDLFDPAICLYPFPNDFFTVADPASDTGRRVDLDVASMPRNLADTPVDPTEWNRNDGFSPGQAIQLIVPGIVLEHPPEPGQPAVIASRPVPVAGIAREWDQARSLDPGSSVVILDAETGERVPHWVELNSRVTPAQGQALLIRPAVNFASGRRYLVALRNLRDGADAVIPAPRAFRLYRDGTPTYVPAIEARRAHMEEVLDALESHGVARDDLYLAWDFTVISKRNMSERLLAMRDDAFAKLGAASPEFVVDQFDSPTARRRYLVRGKVKVPLYLTNQGETGGTDAATRLHCEDDLGAAKPCEGDELPVQAGDYWADFSCTVPTTVVAGDGSPVPARPVLYGHGLLGHQNEAVSGHNQDNAFEHNYVVCGSRWIGMGEEDFGTVAAILNDFSRFPTLADRLHQAMVNFLYVGRAMIHPDGFGTHPAFQVDGASILDGTSLYYDGNSQGAIAGGALAAFAQDYTRAVLGVPGMNYSTLLFRSVDFNLYLGLLQFNYLDPKVYPLMFALAQMLWDRVETNGHANHLTRDTYPGTPAKKILLHVGFGDFQVSDMSAQVEARTIGAHVHRPDFDPFGYVAANPSGLPREFWQEEPHWNIPGIPASDPGPPVAGAEGASYRFDGSALVVWDFGNLQSPNRNMPPSGGNPELGPCPAGRGGDPHECPRRDPRAKLQKSEFLKPDGAVLDVCGGDYCN